MILTEIMEDETLKFIVVLDLINARFSSDIKEKVSFLLLDNYKLIIQYRIAQTSRNYTINFEFQQKFNTWRKCRRKIL